MRALAVYKKRDVMAHYFTNDYQPSHEQIIYVNVRGSSYKFITDNNVFSKKGLDFGTRTLLENLPDVSGDILDLGCGYGPIGIILAENGNVDMTDINQRSLSLTTKNLQLNHRKANVFVSDMYENIDKKYDYIVTNPPVRAGKHILYGILQGAFDYLKEDGELWFVIHKDQGAKTVMKRLAESYEVKLVTKNKGFYIIMCKKR